MPYTICMNNAAHNTTTEPSLYTVNVVSVGYDVTCTVIRYPAGPNSKPRTVAHVREASRAAAVTEARRAVRMARHCGGL